MKIGILITSFPGHKAVLEKCLKRYKGLGFPMVFGWDGAKDPIDHPKLVVTGERKGLQAGEKWLVHHCAKRLAELGCEYVFKTCGDVVVGRPERIAELPKKLGKKDFICQNWDGKGKQFGTKIFFGKLDPLLRVSERWKDDKTGYHIERRYAGTMRNLKIKFKAMDDIDDNKKNGLWYGWLGCRHLK